MEDARSLARLYLCLERFSSLAARLRTNRANLTMSVKRSRSEVAAKGSNRRF
jgi:hypothetical protein